MFGADSSASIVHGKISKGVSNAKANRVRGRSSSGSSRRPSSDRPTIPTRLAKTTSAILSPANQVSDTTPDTTQDFQTVDATGPRSDSSTQSDSVVSANEVLAQLLEQNSVAGQAISGKGNLQSAQTAQASWLPAMTCDSNVPSAQQPALAPAGVTDPRTDASPFLAASKSLAQTSGSLLPETPADGSISKLDDSITAASSPAASHFAAAQFKSLMLGMGEITKVETAAMSPSRLTAPASSMERLALTPALIGPDAIRIPNPLEPTVATHSVLPAPDSIVGSDGGQTDTGSTGQDARGRPSGDPDSNDPAGGNSSSTKLVFEKELEASGQAGIIDSRGAANTILPVATEPPLIHAGNANHVRSDLTGASPDQPAAPPTSLQWEHSIWDPGKAGSTRQLVDAAANGELRLALQTERFGNVELHARIAGNDLGAAITVERKDAHAILATELPSLQHALAEKQFRVEELSLLHGSTTPGFDDSASPSEQRPGQGQKPRAMCNEGSVSVAAIANTVPSAGIFDSQGRLSVHA
jgi:hypothetical protein